MDNRNVATNVEYGENITDLLKYLSYTYTETTLFVSRSDKPACE
jgi:hypothetical protein